MPSRIPWEAAPAWLREDRTEVLLRTKRPRPFAERDWMARVKALQVAVKGLPEGEVRDRAAAEVKAMFIDRSRWNEQQDLAHRVVATEDETRMLWCEMRAIDVRGLTRDECGRRRICYVDGKPLPERRRFWCSDECVELWTASHEWTAASHAALRRDAATCQRCGYHSVLVCNGRHELPGGRVIWGEQQVASKGVTMDMRPPWPCPKHPHPAYRAAVPSEAEPGVCGRCGQAWPCGAAIRAGWKPEDGTYSTVHHWRILRPRGMEVNHKIPRAGRGYDPGCHHHLVDLETLCHPCHVIVTTEQIRERKGIRAPAQVPPSTTAIWDGNDPVVTG